MKSQRELFEALLKGKRVRLPTWDKGKFLYLHEDGDIINEKGCARKFILNYYQDWEVYEEPETIKELPLDINGIPNAREEALKINELIKAVNKLTEEGVK